MRFLLRSSRSVPGEWMRRSEILAAVDRCQTAATDNRNRPPDGRQRDRSGSSTCDFANFDPLPVAEVCSPQLYEEREPKRR